MDMDNAQKQPQNRSLTPGERAVGITFNPGGNQAVDQVKKLMAEVIDLLHENMHAANDRLAIDWHKIAIDQSIDAQMWAVKALTCPPMAPTAQNAQGFQDEKTADSTAS